MRVLLRRPTEFGVCTIQVGNYRLSKNEYLSHIVVSLVSVIVNEAITDMLKFRVTPDSVNSAIFGIIFRSLGRNVPSLLCRLSRSGLKSILDPRQYLIANGIIICSLSLNTDTIHHLIHFS